MITSALAWLHNPTWWTGEPPPGAILTVLLIISIVGFFAWLEKKLDAENTRHDAEVERRYRERTSGRSVNSGRLPGETEAVFYDRIGNLKEEGEL